MRTRPSRPDLRESTDRPFALNHVVPDLDEAAFALTLEAAPAVVSFALDDAGGLMKRVHDVGSLVMQQVHTEEQARTAVSHGADIIVAQGGEAVGRSSMPYPCPSSRPVASRTDAVWRRPSCSVLRA